MRCFIAVDIDDKIRAAVGDLQRQLQGQAKLARGDCRWVKPELMHLTLKFLGEIKDVESVQVCNIAGQVAGRHKSFELDIEKVGHFGGKSARVLWVGTGAGIDKLCDLQEELERQLAEAGFAADAKGFSGHLTLCRIKNPKAGFKLAQMSEQYGNFKIGTISADSVCVYQSQLTPQGPVYTVLGNYKLQ